MAEVGCRVAVGQGAAVGSVQQEGMRALRGLPPVGCKNPCRLLPSFNVLGLKSNQLGR